jgi:hypothetical protein
MYPRIPASTHHLAMHFLDRSFFVVRLITNKVPADANFSFCLVVWFGAGKVSNGEAQQRHPQRPLHFLVPLSVWGSNGFYRGPTISE